MNHWRTALRDGDPAAHAPLSNDDAQLMRRTVLAAVPAPARTVPRTWIQPLLVVATVALMLGTGAMAGRRASQPQPGLPPADVQVEDTKQETRQLQFATSGGTRIIWVFNSEFDLKESIP